MFLRSSLIFIVLMIIFSCEDKKEESKYVFKLTDQGWFDSEFLVFIHDADNPTSEPLALAWVEKEGSVTFNDDGIEGDLLEDLIDSTLDVNLGEISDNLIITTGEYISSDHLYLTSNWHVKKGSKWTMIAAGTGFGYGDTVRVALSAPAGRNIERAYNDIGDYYSVGTQSPRHFVNSVNESGEISISSTALFDDGNYYKGYLENQDWAPGLTFTIDDWVPAATQSVAFTEMADISNMYFWGGKS